MSTKLVILTITLASLVTFCAGNKLQIKFEKRIDKIVSNLLNDENLQCNFWTSILRIHLKETDTFCFESLRNAGLRFCGSEFLPGVVWLLVRYWNDSSIEKVVKGDFMMRLTDLPFWIDEEGSFEDVQNPKCSYNYWSEDDQLVWLTGAYLVGHAFSSNPDLSDVLFSGTDGTGHELIERSRHRLWRWLDQRITYGFNSKLRSMPRMMSCLATLSQLAPDNNFKTFSSIVLWVLVYQFLIQTRWHQNPNSSSVLQIFNDEYQSSPSKLDEDVLIPFLMALRSSDKQEDSLKVPNYILQLAEVVTNNNSLDFELIMDQPNKDGLIRKEIPVEDCIFIFTIFGFDSAESTDCLIILGDKYSLWKRHPAWKRKAKLKKLPLRSFELSYIDREIADQTTGSSRSSKSGKFFTTGDVSSASGCQHLSTSFRIETSNLSLSFSSKGSTSPKIFHKRDFSIEIYNPTILQSAIANMKPTVASFIANSSNTTNGWFVTKTSQTFIGVFSWMPVTFDGEVILSNSSRNVWIWYIGKSVDFDDSMDKFSDHLRSTNVTVQSHPDSIFEKCLEQHRCLERGALIFIECLSSTCQASKFATESSLSKCLLQSSKQSRLKRSIFFNLGVRRGDIEFRETTTRATEMKATTIKKLGQTKEDFVPTERTLTEDRFDHKGDREAIERKLFESKDGILKKLSKLSNCLNKPTGDLIVTIQMKNHLETFRWNDDEFFNQPTRFKSKFGTVFWEDKMIRLEEGEYFLKLDFERLQIFAN